VWDLREALAAAVYLPQRDARPGVLAEAERIVTQAHADAVKSFTAQNRLASEDIDIVGFHGQTVLHRPERRLTVQIGDAAALAKAIPIPVMHDFRAADVAAGGQGAPRPGAGPNVAVSGWLPTDDDILPRKQMRRGRTFRRSR
jgi:anhydro-N-acetylmuramic acid kinase